ncbi:MAG: hypothetical protein ACR2G3_09615 [Solirubrobacterales bacterium]
MSRGQPLNRESPRSTFGLGSLAPGDTRVLGRLAGALFLAGVACAIPATLALQPLPQAERYALIVGGMLVGIGAFFAPWERLGPLWIHLLVAAGILQVALAVALFSNNFGFYYVTVAAYAAYAVPDRRVLALYLALIAVALLAPLAYDGANTREHAHHILVTLPVFLIVAALVVYLREGLERREQSYRRFALEAVSLAIRIRGTGRRESTGADELDRRLGELASQADEELGAGPGSP